MAKFWCWLFGHKWCAAVDWLLANTDYKYAFYCSRCGATGGPINKVLENG